MASEGRPVVRLNDNPSKEGFMPRLIRLNKQGITDRLVDSPRRRIRSAGIRVATLTAVAALGLTGPLSASAAASTVENDTYDQVAVYSIPPSETTYADHYAPNDTRFEMNCWSDGSTERWFFGQVHDTGGWVWVRASEVRDQSIVGHC